MVFIEPALVFVLLIFEFVAARVGVLKLFLMVLAARTLGVFLEWTWILRLVVVVVIGGPPLRDIADRACRMVDPELLSLSYCLLFNGFSFWVVYSLNW